MSRIVTLYYCRIGRNTHKYTHTHMERERYIYTQIYVVACFSEAEPIFSLASDNVVCDNSSTPITGLRETFLALHAC